MREDTELPQTSSRALPPATGHADDSDRPWGDKCRFGKNRMLLLQILGVTLLLLAQSAGEQGHSGEFGSASGTPFSYSGPDRWGPITALRIWEHCNSYISGCVAGHPAPVWAEVYGAKTQAELEVTLLPNERITQVSGKQYTYIYQLIVSTNKGRIFFFGQPYGNSFNAVPLSCTEYLAFLTGHYSGGSLTGIAMQWAEPRNQE
ncbi:zymogen granule membrane protein 16-like [Natator depressus]|uniref:zymogen granule membrane protein 16-like n=1 Tax=Natator depressus TaxID=27790 RepID=UPI003EC0C94F